MEEWMLQSKIDFEIEDKNLEALIREVKSNAANSKLRDTNTGQTNFKEINNNLTKEIYKFNEMVEGKLGSFSAVFENLDQKVEKFKKNTAILIDSFKKVLESLEMTKTDEMITDDVKKQLKEIKNLFFKKVLRTIVIGEDKSEENLNYYRSKLILKEKLLRKSLMAAEFYKGQIDGVRDKKEEIKTGVLAFTNEIQQSIGFGCVKISQELGFNEIRKLQSKDFRADDVNVGIKLVKKTALLCAKSDSLTFFEHLNSRENILNIRLKDIKDIHLLKSNTLFDQVGGNNTSNRAQKDTKILPTSFIVRYTNDKGGFVLEVPPEYFRKWDYCFFITNLLINFPAILEDPVRPFNYEYNLTKIFKSFNFKHLESISIKTDPSELFDFEVQIKDLNDRIQFNNEIITSWKIVEDCQTYLDKLSKNRRDEDDNDAPTNEFKDQKELLQNLALESNHKLHGQINLDNIVKNETEPSKFQLAQFDDTQYGIKKLDDQITYNLSDTMYNLFDKGIPQRRRKDSGLSFGSTAGYDDEDRQPEIDLDMSIDSNMVPEGQLFYEETDEENEDDDEDGEANPQRAGANKNNKGKLSRLMYGVPGRSTNVGGTPFNQGSKGMVSGLAQSQAGLRNTSMMQPFMPGTSIKGVGSNLSMDNFNFEKSMKMNILQNLFRGLTAKGSGLRENSGEFVIKLAEDQRTLYRVNIRTKREEKRQVGEVTGITYKFSYPGAEGKIKGATITVVTFTDQSYWEFKTRLGLQNRHIFFTSLLSMRLNKKEFNF